MAWLSVCHGSIGPLSLGICRPCGTFRYSVQRYRGQSSVNYYDILRLRPNASQSQIKSAYYQLSKLYHPDTAKNLPNSKEMFARLTAAYEVLGNPHKRALYDRAQHSDASYDHAQHPGASFTRVGENDREYRDFLRRRGTFSPRQNASTSTRRPVLEFDEFYKQNYGKSLRYNWEAKKNSDYQRMKQAHASAESSGNSAMFGLLITACAVAAFFFIK